MNKLLHLLFSLFLVAGCSLSPQNYTSSTQEQRYFSSAELWAKQSKWMDAYYYIEDNLNSIKPEIKLQSYSLINAYPKIISDYSVSSFQQCQSYGKEKCRALMSRRLNEYKKNATEADYNSALLAFNGQFGVSIIQSNISEQNINNEEDANKNIIIQKPKLFENKSAFGFKYFVLGSTESSLIGKSTGWHCIDNPKKLLGDRNCYTSNNVNVETIAGIIPKSIFLFFNDDQLTTISITIKSSEFRQVYLALSEKYGKGTVKSEILTNRMGAKFSSEEAKWEVGDFRVSIKERSGTIDESRVLYLHKFAQDSFKDRVEKQSINNAKDL